MHSARWCSDQRGPGGWWSGALFLKNAARFWPIWASYLAIWAFLVPGSLVLDALGSRYRGGPTYEGWAENILRTAEGFSLLLAALYAVACAMAVFSYLYQSRSVNFVHSLPVRREGLFLTNYLSGLAFQLVPQVLVFLLTLAVEGAWGMVTFPAALQWLLSVGGVSLFFYSFAVFCAMFTGHILALPAFYGILNFLAYGMAALIEALLQRFIYGFVGGGDLSELACWFSPFIKLWERVHVDYSSEGIPYLEGFLLILLYALAGVVLTGAALALYRRRQMERAGDVVAVAWVRPIFKYGVAVCAATALATAAKGILEEFVPVDHYGMIGLILLFGLLGYFAAEMLLRKSFRVFGESWKGAAVLCALLAAACVMMSADVLGLGGLPALADVEKVQIMGINSYPYDGGAYFNYTYQDSDDLKTVIDLHRYIYDHRTTLREESQRWGRRYYEDSAVCVTDMRLTYLLRDGSFIEREYDIPLHAPALADPQSLESRINALLNDPQVAMRQYFEVNDREKVVEAYLSVWNTETGEYEQVVLETEREAAALWEAMKADVAAGDLGKRFLFWDEDRESICYTSNVVFGLYAGGGANQGDRPAAEVQSRREICLQTTGKRSLACLARLGVLDETHVLRTHAEEK